MKHNTFTRPLFIAATAVFFLSLTVSGEVISLSGIVKNRANNAAIPGAAVMLEGYGLTTVSDASGNFTLAGQTTGVVPGTSHAIAVPKKVLADSRGIRFAVSAAGRVTIVFNTLGGRSVSAISQDNLVKGQWRFTPRLTPGFYICRAEINGSVSTLKYRCAAASSSGALLRTGDLPIAVTDAPVAKLSAATYTLAVSKSKFVTSRQSLASGTATNLAVLLDSIKFTSGMTDQQARDMLRSLIGTDSIVFIKRNTYNSNHYYTTYVNADWLPGGNICMLNLKDGSVRNIINSLPSGVYKRFDISYDGKKVLFDFKRSIMTGYRIYEADITTGAVRQISFPQANEDSLITVYKTSNTQSSIMYHHGTDDMEPCYLPDGGIAFITTRCQIGTPCDAPDAFTTTNVWRMDIDGKNMKPLSSRGMASESQPTVMGDGRILYTRWEYVDKGGSCVKALWSMFPGGAGQAEVYGVDIDIPPARTQARVIPGANNKYVMMGGPHCCPGNLFGSIIRVNMNKYIRSTAPMEYITGEVKSPSENGWSWTSGKEGNLYSDPYPLSEELFLVSFKPGSIGGTDCYLKNGYGLYVLDGKGASYQFYRDATISCWEPYPCKPRPVEPVPYIPLDPTLAAKNQAVCTVNDIYFGMENTARGSIKYIRILEQLPRPWTARRFWSGDGQGNGQQHSPISKFTRLWPALFWGVVPVESDGSANFYVPADRAIFFQALDSSYRMIQFERTWVNYKPGETRSCHGCHETPDQVIPPPAQQPIALRRAPSAPGPQPGDTATRRVLYYPDYVQPIFDKNCVSCHNQTDLKGSLNLKGGLTYLWSTSYEQLLDRRTYLGKPIDEIGPKVGNAAYMPAKSMYSNQSVIMKMLGAPGIAISNATLAARAATLANQHKAIKLTQAELVNLGLWIDNDCQYYGHYWGRRGTEYQGRADFRPRVTFEQALDTLAPKF